MKRLVQCAAIAALTYVSAPVEAQTVELEGALVGGGTSIGPGFRFGVVLNERLTLGAGVAATFASTESYGGVGSLGGLSGGGSIGGIGGLGGAYSHYAIVLPVDLRLYLVPPSVGVVSPTFRLVASYARSNLGNEGGTSAYSGGLLAGALYMLDDTIGVSIECGVRYTWAYSDFFGLAELSSEVVDVAYRASVVLRI